MHRPTGNPAGFQTSDPGSGHKPGGHPLRRCIKFVIGCSTILGLSLLPTDRLAAAPRNDPDVVRCKSVVADMFLVGGPNEESTAVLSRNGKMAYLAFRTPVARHPITLAVGGPYTAKIHLEDPEKKSGMGFSVNANGDTSLVLTRNPLGYIDLSAPTRGRPSLNLVDGHDVRRMGIGALDGAGPLITLSDKQGKFRLGLTADSTKATAVIVDNKTGSSSFLIDGLTETCLYFNDRKKKLRLSLRSTVPHGSLIDFVGPDGLKELAPP